jgi:putative DNA primase/helicase
MAAEQDGKSMTPKDDIGQYLQACGFDPQDTISVVWKGRSGALGWTTTTVEAAWKPIDGHRLVDCWISANAMTPPKDRKSRGDASDVYAIRALWADLDVEPGKMPSYPAAQAVIDEVSQLIGAQPVAIVASGHGLQPRWRIDFGDIAHHAGAADFLEHFGRIVQAVALRHGGKADSVYDLPRIIRAPGTTNCKKIEVKVKLKLTGSRDVARMEDVIGAVAPVIEPPAPPREITPKAEEVDLSRGDRYVASVIAYISEELQSIASWSIGEADDRGRGWEKIQADAAYRLAELVKADWNSLTEAQALQVFFDNAPKDENWTKRDVVKKWKSQWSRAEASQPPSIVDDPLSPGYEPPPPIKPVPPVVVPPPVESEPAPPPEPWRKYTWDDFGNAERTVALHGDLLRWSPLLERWFRYVDGAWRESKTGGEKAVQDMVRALPDLESALYSAEEYRKGKNITSDRLEFLDFTKTCRSANKVRAAATVMKNDGELDVGPRAFDNDPMLLNTVNGVIELRSGELLEHSPSLMLHRQAPVAFDADAKAPMWEAFIARAMPNEQDRAYLQRIVGYSITGRTSEQAVFLHHGVTLNGKSVFLRVLEAMLGDFARVVPPTTLLMKRNEAHPTEIMGLEGRRLLQVSELPEGARLEEALVKRLSGEETITARGMGEDFRDMKISGKIHIVTNPLPHIGDDVATKRRIHMVHWAVSIPVEERDPLLADRIIASELPGVLAWAVRGALEWGRIGLQPPVGTQMARDEYFASEDEFGMFIDEELIVGADSFTSTKDLYRRYAQWCDGLRAKPMSSVAFGRKLGARGLQPSRTNTSRGFKVALSTPSWSPIPPDLLS